MILKTKVPGRVVQRRKRLPGGRYKIVPWFKFDDKGFAEIDETKLNQVMIQKLKSKFEVVEKKEKKVDSNEEAIRQQAKEAGIKSWHVKAIKRLKEELEA